MKKLVAAQGANGGIRSFYALDGSFSLDQQGTAKSTVFLCPRVPQAGR